jgi:hypothetical protein
VCTPSCEAAQQIGAMPVTGRDALDPRRSSAMPKEVIQYPATIGNSGTELSVHWSKGGDSVLSTAGEVQIATTRHVWIPDQDSGHSISQHADHNNCAECVSGADAQVDDGLTGWGNPGDPATVYTEPMGRGEINALIRVLRRARDQAFGTDA